MSDARDLERPPIVDTDVEAREVLRVWAAPNNPQQLTLRTTWKDPGAWGLLLVDVARHVANAYAREGEDRSAVLARYESSGTRSGLIQRMTLWI